MPPSSPLSIVPVPSSASPIRPTSRAVVVPDPVSVIRLIEEVIDRSGLSRTEISDRLGVRKQSFNQYTYLRKKRPSVQWLARLVDVCGGKLIIEFPPSPLS